MALNAAQKAITFGLVQAQIGWLESAEYLRATQAQSVAYAASTDPTDGIVATLVTEINNYRAANGATTWTSPNGAFSTIQPQVPMLLAKLG